MFAATNVAAALVKRPKFSGEYIFQVMNTLHIEQLPPEWESIAHVFSALGDVTRQKIILLFEPGEEIGLKAIVDCFPLSRTAVSHHVNTLEQAGMLVPTKRGREVFYTLNLELAFSAMAQFKDYAKQMLAEVNGTP